MIKRVRHFSPVAHQSSATLESCTTVTRLGDPHRDVTTRSLSDESENPVARCGFVQTTGGDASDLERRIDSARAAGKTKIYGLSGLVVTLRKDSKMTFLLRWSKNKRVRWKNLGEWPSISIQAAIDLAKYHKIDREKTPQKIRCKSFTEPRQVIKEPVEKNSSKKRKRRIGKLPFRSINAIARFLYKVNAAIIPHDIRVAIGVMVFVPMACEEVIFGLATDLKFDGDFAFIDVKSKVAGNKAARSVSVYLPRAIIYELRKVLREESDHHLFPRLAAMEREDALSEISAEIEMCNKEVGISLNGFLESFRTLAKRKSFISASAINSLCDHNTDSSFYQPSFLHTRIGVMEWWAAEISNAYDEVSLNFDRALELTGLLP